MKWLVILSCCYHVIAANNFLAGLIVTVSLALLAVSRRVDMKCEECGYENKIVAPICTWCKEWLPVVKTKGGKR